jgi:hypothetical protein
LWFVAYLWVYTVVLYVGVLVLPGATARLRSFAERRLTGVGIVLWPLAYLVLIRMFLAPHFPQTDVLVGDWYNHALYGAIFLLGFALAGTRAPWAALVRARWIALGVAILAWGYVCALMGMYGDEPGIPPTKLFIGRVAYAAEQWLVIVAILGFAHRHLVHDSAARRYLTTAIFPVYILHQTVIVVCAHALKPAHLNPVVESVLLILVTASTSLLFYEVIRRVPLLRPLFGLALPRTPRKPQRRPVTFAPLAVPQDVN